MKFFNAVLGVLCGLLSFFSGVVWLNNVYLSWIKRIWMLEGKVALQIQGLIPIFDFFCIDHSTVSTFIPFFSLLWLTWGFYRIHRWANSNETIFLKEEFPYFPGYNEWMVALGLMGTVWGLIMIGYLPNLENLKISDLIGALRTALFSTLVALFWVYIIVLRFINPSMKGLARKCIKTPATPRPEGSLPAALKNLTDNLELLNLVLGDSTEIIEKFKTKVTVKKLEEADKFFKICTETLPEMKDASLTQIIKLTAIEELFKQQLSTTNQHFDYFKKMIKSHEAQGQRLAAISKFLKQKGERDVRNRQRFRRILEIFKGYNENEVK